MTAQKQMQSQPWIKARTKELGKTLKGLGEAMGGLDSARVTEIMAGTRRVGGDEVSPMAAYLELPYEVVYQRLYGSVPSLSGDVRHARPIQQVGEQETLRIFHAREAGGGIVELSDEPALRVPTIFATSPDAFGCYVVTDHMVPAYERGDCLIVNTVQPAAPGNDVLVISGGNGEPRRATLRNLVAISDSHWVVRQWNPPTPKGEKLDRKIWHTAYRIEGVRRR